MSYENSAGLGVNNQYGVRDTQDSAAISGGVIEGGGAAKDYVLYITGDELSTSDTASNLTIPAGSVIVGAVLEIVEAVTMAFTTDDIEFGTAGSVVTNGVQFNDTDGVVGTYAPASYNGTWAAGSVLAADTNVGSLLTGTGSSDGKMKLVVTVRKV